MRLALISDVHANTEALGAVLAALEHAEIDALACLGDLVGYHAEPNECIERVVSTGAHMIAGNHDLAAVGRMDWSDFGAAARRSAVWTRRVLTEESREVLARLPLTCTLGSTILLFHGALHPEPNAELHLSTRARVDRTMQALRRNAPLATIGCFGHTHRAKVFELSGGKLGERLGARSEARISLEPGCHYLVNPGSVGQPRDGDDRAAYAILDTGRSHVELRRVAYDVAAARAKTARAGLLDSGPAAEASWARRIWQRFRSRASPSCL